MSDLITELQLRDLEHQIATRGAASYVDWWKNIEWLIQSYRRLKATPTASPAPSALREMNPAPWVDKKVIETEPSPLVEMPRCNQGVLGILECSLPKGHSGPCSTEVDTPTAQAAPPADRSFEDGVEAGLELAVQWLNNPLNYRRYALDTIKQIRALKRHPTTAEPTAMPPLKGG